MSGHGRLPAVSGPAAWLWAGPFWRMFVLWSTAELPELQGSAVLSSVPGGSAPLDPLDVAAPGVAITPR